MMLVIIWEEVMELRVEMQGKLMQVIWVKPLALEELKGVQLHVQNMV